LGCTFVLNQSEPNARNGWCILSKRSFNQTSCHLPPSLIEERELAFSRSFGSQSVRKSKEKYMVLAACLLNAKKKSLKKDLGHCAMNASQTSC
jgi:hypothetical protein